MSDLLFSWLNDEVQLSQKITNFPEDFANGYFFGELLHKHNQQLNFHEFQNKDTRQATLTNFKLLFPTFKTLNVPFDSKIVHKVQNRDKNTSTSLLYQLKMALEKVNNPADVLIYSKTGKYNTVTPLIQIKPPKEQFDTMENEFFKKRIEEINKGQKQTNLEKHLFPFEEFKQRQDKILKKLKQKDEQDIKNLQYDIRKFSLGNIQRNMAFMDDWEKKGNENWNKNLEIRRKRVEADKTFKRTMEETQKNKLQKMQELTRNEVLDDIDNFEGTLRKQGLAPSQEVEDEDDPELSSKEIQLRKSENKFSLAGSLQGGNTYKHKESKQMADWKRKERDKRRRKMIVDQQKIQREIEVQKRRELVLEKLKMQSRQEKEIEYEIWRAQQCKDIIYKNRELRDNKYREKQELNIQNAKFKEEAMVEVLKEEFDRDVEQKQVRQSEIQIRYKQQERKENYKMCGGLLDVILDLADITYEHQQNSDSNKIEKTFWNDQLRLFVENKALVPNIQTIELANSSKIENQDEQQKIESDQNQENQENKEENQNEQIQQTETQENEIVEKIQDSKKFLAFKELEDYINGKGQWAPQHKEEKDENPEKITPNIPINNTLLGDMVVKILEQNHQDDLQKIKNSLKSCPDFNAIKAILYGYQFSGKHTLSDFLAKKYNIQVFRVDALVQELLEGIQEQEQEQEKEMSQEQIEKNRQLGQKIQDLLVQGEEINDELYVEVVMNKVDSICPKFKNDDVFNEFYKNLPEKQESQQDILDDDEDQMESLKYSPEDQFKKNLINKKYKFTQGWVLLDFPHTYNQAKLLEKALSGFRPKDEIEKTELENKIENMSKIVKASDMTIVPRELINGGIDIAFYLDINKKESLRRACGRRIDKLTGSEYHLDENLPPIDNAPLVERLVQIRDFETAENTIIDKNCELDQQLKDLEEWFSMFGFDKQVEETVKVMRPVKKQEDNQDQPQDEQNEGEEQQQDENTQQKQEQSSQKLSQKGEKEDASQNLAASKKSLKESKQSKNQEEKQSENQEKEEKNEQEQKKEEEYEQEKEIEMEEVEEIQVRQEKIVSWQQVNASQSIFDVFYNVDQFITDLLDYKERVYKSIDNKLQEKQKQEEELAEIERIQKENEGKLLKMDYQDIKEQMQNIESQFKLDDKILTNFEQRWGEIQEQYLDNTQDVFLNLKEQKETIVFRFSQIQKNFLNLIQRPDNKFKIIRDYQETYNKFVSDYPDMCEEDATKEELHQRVEDLHDELYDIIETKKQNALDERNQIMGAGWVENQMELFCLQIQKLISTEINKSFGCQQLIVDYYSLLNRTELPEVPEYFKVDMVQNQETLPPVQEGENFPRIEKLFNTAIALSQGEAEIEDKDKKKAGGKAAPKKDDKKAGKGKKEEPEVVKEPTKYELEMKEALVTEKQILRYRLNVIKDFGISRLNEIRAMSKILYNKLEDWTLYTYKCENDAINNILEMFQDSIEKEQKIQKELQLNFLDVIISHQVLNFLTPPTVILPARELSRKDRFTISQLYIIIEELRGIMSEQSFEIQVDVVLQLFYRKIRNQLSLNELPQIWRQLKNEDFQNLVLGLDQFNVGYIQGKDLCTYICLLNANIVTQDEIDQYLYQLSQINQENQQQQEENGQQQEQQFRIVKDKFIDCPAPFDASQVSEMEENTNIFNRPRFVKELLFYIHKDQESNMLDINSYLNSLSCTQYLGEEDKYNYKNYNELLFNLHKFK